MKHAQYRKYKEIYQIDLNIIKKLIKQCDKNINLVTNSELQNNTVGAVVKNNEKIPLISSNSSVKITPVLMNQPMVNAPNSVNNTQIIMPNVFSVILQYQIPELHVGSGYFSLDSAQDVDAPEVSYEENYDQSSILSNIGSTISSITSGFNFNAPSNSYKNIYNNLLGSIVGFDKSNSKSTDRKSDLLFNLPLIQGAVFNLNLSTTDSFQKPVNFIKQNSLLFISNGLSTTIVSTKTIPVLRNDYHDNKITSTIILNNQLPITLPSTSYVISTAPVLPYVVLKYISNYDPLNIINSGSFSLLHKSATITVDTIVMSNFDGVNNINILSFNSILYTIIDNPKLTLQILNPDFSVIASLSIVHVMPNNNQTTFTYNVVSGASSLSKLIVNTNYIFTLLSTSDVITINNNTKYMKKSLIYAKSVISGTRDIITHLYDKNLNDPKLLLSNTLIKDATMQAELLLYTPYTDISNVVNNSLIVNAYNAISYALQSQPDNHRLKFMRTRINNFSSPIITIALLENIDSHLSDALVKSPHNKDILEIRYRVEISIDKIKNNLNTINNNNNTPSVSIETILEDITFQLNDTSNKLPKNEPVKKALITLKDNAKSSLPDNAPITIPLDQFSVQPANQITKQSSYQASLLSSNSSPSISPDTTYDTIYTTTEPYHPHIGAGLLILFIAIGVFLYYGISSRGESGESGESYKSRNFDTSDSEYFENRIEREQEELDSSE
jgi:hypothetical protein